MRNITVIGSSGALGGQFLQQLAIRYPQATVYGFSRNPSMPPASNVTLHSIDYRDEETFRRAAAMTAETGALDEVIVATGVLHDGKVTPEKALKDLSAEKFQHLFMANTIVPALVAKHFLPLLNRNHRAIFAAISARVGSISDNQLGGWYAYRASKAALNMVLKNAAIEIARTHPHAIVVGLHPGTVDSGLSKPFQTNVREGKLFTPEFAVNSLLDVLETLTPKQSGKCFAWDGQEIQP